MPTSSVIIDNFDLFCIATAPFKTDTPLIVNAQDRGDHDFQIVSFKIDYSKEDEGELGFLKSGIGNYTFLACLISSK
jgi:hypothetical protein